MSSINLSWVAIVCKLFNLLFINCSIILVHWAVIIIIISFCILLCGMKMLECTRTSVIIVGFIDPDKVHVHTLKMEPKETARNILRFLNEQHFCNSILFPYNFESESYSLVHIHICFLDIKCNWWVTDLYINMCMFHWILMKIEVDNGRVQVLDPLKKYMVATCRICSKSNFQSF
jgi:hypothetical protein